MRFNLNYYGITGMVRTLAKDARLTIVYHDDAHFEEKGAQAYTTASGQLHVLEPSLVWTDVQFGDWAYRVFHEMGHHQGCRKGCMEAIEQANGGLLGFAVNLIEDAVMERTLCRDTPALVAVMHTGRARFIEDLAALWEDEPPNELSGAMMMWDTITREFWQPDMRGPGDTLRPAVPAGSGELLDKLLPFSERLDHILSVDEVVHLARDIVAVLEDEDEDEDDDEDGEGDDGDGDDNEEDEEDDEDEDGEEGDDDDDDDDDDDGGEAGEEDEEDEDGEQQGAWAPDSRCLPTNGSPDATPTAAASAATGTPGTYTVDNEPCNLRLDKGDDWPDDWTVALYARCIMPPTPPSTLTRKFTRYLQTQSRTRRTYGTKSGSLHGKNLYRLGIEGAAPQWQRRVFKRKRNAPSLRRVAVTLLVDVSGSMNEGTKARDAIHSLVHIHQALQGLGIKVEVGAFGVADGGATLNVVLQSAKRPVPTSVVEERLRKIMPTYNNNRDGESLLYFAGRLAKQNVDRRILIVLSDGVPKPPRQGYGNGGAFLRTVLEDLANRPTFSVYGLGLLSDAVERLYPPGSSATLLDTTKLESTLLSVLKNTIGA